ncbi:hypothetical protein [Veronia pacifica]|uniref:Uncharacterized protein n=1 Tax=Veronia pacifica TaxID=1080227 RepID=A0A1C3EMC2_9GAMM|nr:hypothetical protein [Veronia pacifica]ODA34369.1 hypothetical protein A8L45_06495 [Veronia pacifica]
MANNALTNLKWLLRLSGSVRNQLYFSVGLTLMHNVLTLLGTVILFLILDELIENTMSYGEVTEYVIAIIFVLAIRYTCLSISAYFAHKASFSLIRKAKVALLKSISSSQFFSLEKYRNAEIEQTD